MLKQPLPQIGKIVQHALAFNAQRWQDGSLPMDDLLQAVNDLFALIEQRQLAYVLVGGIAMLQYVQGRNTEDIDLILHGADLVRLPELDLTSQSTYFARGIYQGLQIDLLLTDNPLFEHVQRQHSMPQPFFERTITTATVHGLILLKLYALPSLYRQGDFARVGLYENDIATLMFYHQPDMAAISTELAAFVSAQDRQALDEIIADLQRRVTRVRFAPKPHSSEEGIS
ncbi:MAG: hypothetical protein AB4911_08165 [Oscillochloridaceae bacterium umkhey_bin13]